ncbi:glycosyl transferase family 1, partial [Candidatus Bipolaricaulota bacterium]|nr:glycosyl transferase family 1 [Candidatus Bipolaricaulota bacterium]
YLARLKRKIDRTGIDARFISEKILSRRKEIDGERRYSLWDSYVFADLVTYPSLFEGWGNQFLEAIRARLPIAVFEYPVYRSDIQCKGFDVISLGNKLEGTDDLGLVTVNEKVLRQATEKSVEVLTDSSRRRAMVERNFDLGKCYYSLESLEEQLANVIGRAGSS